MVSVRALISFCTFSQVTRRVIPRRPKTHVAIGTKARAITVMTGSVVTIRPAATTSNRTTVRQVIIPLGMNDLAPSISSIPRVIRSPEWTLSWKPKERRCSFWKKSSR